MGIEFNLQLQRDNFTLDLFGKFFRETIGIYGPSGAGKTTLFNLINGSLKPDSGYITIDGRTVVDTDQGIFIPAHKRNIGVVFQDKLLFPHLTVKENLLFGVKYSVRRRFQLEKVADILNLTSLINKYPAMLSGGESQRVAIGRALMTSPELLLMDEPFNAVDYTLRDTILTYLKRILDEYKIPALIISHDLSDLKVLTETIYRIENGFNTTRPTPALAL